MIRRSKHSPWKQNWL